VLRTPHESAFENISKDRSASVDCEDDLPPEASDPQPAPLLHTPLHLARDGRNCTLRKHREWSGCVHFPPDCAPAGYGATADSEQLRRTADCALLVQPGARVVHPAPIGQRATDLRAIRVYRKAATGERIAPRATAQSRTHANWTQAGKDRAELPAHSPHLCLRPARTVRRQHPHRRQQPPMADCWTSRMRCTSNARSRAISSARSASSRSADVVTTIKSTRDSFSRARRPTEGSPPQATAPRASVRNKHTHTHTHTHREKHAGISHTRATPNRGIPPASDRAESERKEHTHKHTHTHTHTHTHRKARGNHSHARDAQPRDPPRRRPRRERT